MKTNAIQNLHILQFNKSPFQYLDGHKRFFMTIQTHWVVAKTIHVGFWMVTEVFFCHYPTVYCKYLHCIWMVTKGLSQPFTSISEFTIHDSDMMH